MSLHIEETRILCSAICSLLPFGLREKTTPKPHVLDVQLRFGSPRELVGRRLCHRGIFPWLALGVSHWGLLWYGRRGRMHWSLGIFPWLALGFSLWGRMRWSRCIFPWRERGLLWHGHWGRIRWSRGFFSRARHYSFYLWLKTIANDQWAPCKSKMLPLASRSSTDNVRMAAEPMSTNSWPAPECCQLITLP